MRNIRVDVEQNGTLTVLLDGESTNLGWTMRMIDAYSDDENNLYRINHLSMFKQELDSDSNLNDEERHIILTSVSDQLTKIKVGTIQ